MSILTSPLIENLSWVRHGFGTRDEPVSQDGMASLKQIHSRISLVADGRSGCVGEGDALVSSKPGVMVSIRTADCFPVLLVDTENRAVAAVHAGWRGTVAEILVETLRHMGDEFGTRPLNVMVAIGPGIGACCYEVGEDVARKFGKDAAGYLDLARENFRQLVDAGVPGEQIDVTGACTFCDPARFHSYRRDGERAGRMISYIGVA